jgi:hypothetical protein
MTNQTKRPNLHLVRTPHRVPVNEKDFLEPGPQTSLFPRLKPGLLIFVLFPDVTEEEFRDTVEYSQPALVMELRKAPRFDIGRLNRREAFQVFAHHQSVYVDLTSASMGKFHSEDIVSTVTEFLRVRKPAFDRPIMFLLDRSDSSHALTTQIFEAIKPGASEVCEVPRFNDSSLEGIDSKSV